MTVFENYISSLQRFGIQPGLERIESLLRRLDAPHLKYPHILVGGTNGKGSTCEFLSRLLAADGKQIGLYTSPHLYRWNERIRVIAGQQAAIRGQNFPDAITDEDLEELFCAAKPHLDFVAQELGQPTEFETITALAFWHFARTKVDAAVLEVGLGGRWDATNTSNPTVSVITHVALDHCDRLGKTVVAIALDKVEIARTGRVLVTAETKPEVLDIFAARCSTIGARLWPIFALEYSHNCPTLQNCLTYVHSAPLPDDAFQRINWQTALAAQFAFAHTQKEQLSTPRAIDFQVPGRLEVIQEKPRIVLDVCNNPDGAEFLARAFRSKFPDAKGRTILVLGILADKDYDAMTLLLAPLAKIVIATQSQSPRAARACSIAALARPFCSRVEVLTPVKDAMQRALALANSDDTILVAGSFTNISEAMEEIAVARV